MQFPGGSGFSTNLIVTVLIFIALIAGYTIYTEQKEEIPEIPLSELAAEIKEGNVQSVTVEGNDIDIVFNDETEKVSKKEPGTALTETLTHYGVSAEALAGVEISVQEPSGIGVFLLNAAPFIIPILFVIFFIWLLSRQMRGSNMQAFTFGKSKARLTDPEDLSKKVTFDDVAGVKEAKNELKEIVDFLKNPKKYLKIGAKIPKGVLLMGEPGTGKTLLARAVAGQAEVPFFSISGSEFVEMFVGVGASRVRDMFEVAKKMAPAIIFIDEIDAVGRTRGSGYGGGHDEREQTLNQILVEMDGFEPNEKVIVMAATNRPDVLDPALLRPGRFDRRIKLDLPDINDREKILEIHAKEKPLTEDVNLRVIAERTPGFSGADLESLVNEAAIVAAREERKKVSQYDLVRSIEKVMLGPERQSHLLSEKEKKITAYHEAGHALVASVLPHADPVHKVSIISRGHAAGYTLNLPTEEKRFRSKKEFLDQLAVALGGYVTEQMIFGDLTTGPSNDLKSVTKRSRDMVTRYGMSDRIGPLALETDTGEPLYGNAPGFNKEYSEQVSAEIDEEVRRIVKKARDRAQKAIEDNKELLEDIVAELMEHETIEQDDFDGLLRKHGIKPKKDER